MDCIGTSLLSDSNNIIHIQIGLNWLFACTNLIGLIRTETMDAVFIFLGINSNRLQAQFMTGTNDSNCYFATIGN